MMGKKPAKKLLFSVSLTREEHDLLTRICAERGQSKADFLRGALQVHARVPVLNSRPNLDNGRLRGGAYRKHLERMKREAEEKKRRKGRRKR